LRELFESCGEIQEVRVAVDKRTGESKGHGLVQFKEAASIVAAFQLNKKRLHGNLISVLKSKYPAVVERTEGIEHEAKSGSTAPAAVVKKAVPTSVTMFKPRAKPLPAGTSQKKKMSIAQTTAPVQKETDHGNINVTGSSAGELEEGRKNNTDFRALYK
jgi:RNA recognition motif-containing protein